MMLAVAAAPIRKIPYLGYLLAGEAVIFNEILAESAIDIPSPTFAAARPFFAGVLHGVVVRLLFFRRKL